MPPEPPRQLADLVGPIPFPLGPDAGFTTGPVPWANGVGYMP